MMVEDLGENEVYDKCVEKSMINDKEKKRSNVWDATVSKGREADTDSEQPKNQGVRSLVLLLDMRRVSPGQGRGVTGGWPHDASDKRTDACCYRVTRSLLCWRKVKKQVVNQEWVYPQRSYLPSRIKVRSSTRLI